MPYWTPADEVRYGPEALTVVKSLFPDRPQDDPDTTGAARSIFAWLTFRERPTPAKLAAWLSRFEEVDQRIAGTPLAALVSPDLSDQRARVRSMFSGAAAAFRLLPPESETVGRWSAADWALERDGWLFLPGRAEIRESLRPLVSLWLDSLLVRLVNSAEGGARPVWIILDRLEGLQRLPQLPAALTEGRSANLRVVLCSSGHAGIEARYGEDAETLLGGPVTKIFLRAGEPRSAKWVSECIGSIEVEYLSHAKSTVAHDHSGKRKVYHLDRCVEPLVMDSAIQGLADLTGYFTSGNLVVPTHFPWVPQERKQRGFVPRPIDSFIPVVKPQAAAVLSSGAPHGVAVPSSESEDRAPQ